jgi:hypothetical protein
LILLAKSGICEIYVGQAIENPMRQPAGRRETDFASSIAFGDKGG